MCGEDISRFGQSIIVRPPRSPSVNTPHTLEVYLWNPGANANRVNPSLDVLSAAMDTGTAVALVLIYFWYVPSIPCHEERLPQLRLMGMLHM